MCPVTFPSNEDVLLLLQPASPRNLLQVALIQASFQARQEELFINFLGKLVSWCRKWGLREESSREISYLTQSSLPGSTDTDVGGWSP